MNSEIMPLFLLTYEPWKAENQYHVSTPVCSYLELGLSLELSSSWHHDMSKSCILFCPDSFILKMVLSDGSVFGKDIRLD